MDLCSKSKESGGTTLRSEDQGTRRWPPEYRARPISTDFPSTVRGVEIGRARYFSRRHPQALPSRGLTRPGDFGACGGGPSHGLDCPILRASAPINHRAGSTEPAQSPPLSHQPSEGWRLGGLGTSGTSFPSTVRGVEIGRARYFSRIGVVVAHIDDTAVSNAVRAR